MHDKPFSSIALKLLFSFVVVSVIIMGISLFIINTSTKIIREQITDSYSHSLLMLSTQLNESLNRLSTISHSLAADDDINVLNYKPHSFEVVWEYNSLLNQLRNTSSVNDFSPDISIYLINKNELLSSQYGLDNILPGKYIGEFTDNKSEMNSTDHIDKLCNKWFIRIKPADSKKKVLTYTVLDKPYYRNSNIIVTVDIEENRIKKLLNNLKVQNYGTAFLLVGKDSLIYPDTNEVLNIDTIKSKIFSSPDSVRNFTYSSGKDDVRVIYSKIFQGNLILAMCFPENIVMTPIKSMRKYIVIFIFIFLFLSAVYVRVSYKSFLNPVYILVDAMKRIRGGDFNIRLSYCKNNEFTLIITQFNKMIEQINTLINDVYVARLKQQDAQLKLLESQIKPHYLYNCLNFIYHMSINENTDAAAKMALYLGKYFRNSFDANEDLIPVGDELENVLLYLNIQQLRFSDKLAYNVSVSDKVMKVKIPRLSIQTIIENSFVHGLETTHKKGIISIKSIEDESKISIVIEDNGQGINNEKLEELNKKLCDFENPQNNFGISNTHWRLKFKYGNNAGLRLENRTEGGIRVVLEIPSTADSA